MADRLSAVVGQEVLFGDIGDVRILLVLGQQVVERLVLARTALLGDRGVPFLGIGRGAS